MRARWSQLKRVWSYRLACQFRVWAERLDPRPETVGPDEPVSPLQTAYRVSKVVPGRRWAIYSGPSGSKARDVVIAERQRRGSGTTLFEMRKPTDEHWVVRETFTNPE